MLRHRKSLRTRNIGLPPGIGFEIALKGCVTGRGTLMNNESIAINRSMHEER